MKCPSCNVDDPDLEYMSRCDAVGCEARVCDDCMVECSTCRDRFCPKDSKKCDGCVRTVCYAHTTDFCPDCGQALAA